MLDSRQGIEHVVASEQGLVLPGMVIAAGDSHTTTHGAMGALGFGIGSSEIEHLLATQTLVYTPMRNMRVTVDGPAAAPASRPRTWCWRSSGRSAPTAPAAIVIEYAGEAITAMSVEGRLTLCNMSVEAAARGAHRGARRHGLRLPARPARGCPPARAGTRRWRPGAAAQRRRRGVRASRCRSTPTRIAPMVTWGTSPDQGDTIDGGGARSRP